MDLNDFRELEGSFVLAGDSAEQISEMLSGMEEVVKDTVTFDGVYSFFQDPENENIVFGVVESDDMFTKENLDREEIMELTGKDIEDLSFSDLANMIPLNNDYYGTDVLYDGDIYDRDTIYSMIDESILDTLSDYSDFFEAFKDNDFKTGEDLKEATFFEIQDSVGYDPSMISEAMDKEFTEIIKNSDNEEALQAVVNGEIQGLEDFKDIAQETLSELQSEKEGWGNEVADSFNEGFKEAAESSSEKAVEVEAVADQGMER